METKTKGLRELLDENGTFDATEVIVDIPLASIKPNPYQPRYIFDDDKISELALSIKEHGLFQPIIVKKMNGYYSIVSGERRYRACKKLNMETIPCIVRMYEKSKMIKLALIENLQRENLSVIEEAKAYLQIMRELDYTQKEVAMTVGKSRSYVTNMLGLLRLPEDVLELIDRGEISMGHARALSKLEDVDKIRSLAKEIVEKGLTVRKIESLAKNEKKKNTNIKANVSNEYSNYEDAFNAKYKAKLKVRNNKVFISTANKEVLSEILDKITK